MIRMFISAAYFKIVVISDFVETQVFYPQKEAQLQTSRLSHQPEEVNTTLSSDYHLSDCL